MKRKHVWRLIRASSQWLVEHPDDPEAEDVRYAMRQIFEYVDKVLKKQCECRRTRIAEQEKTK